MGQDNFFNIQDNFSYIQDISQKIRDISQTIQDTFLDIRDNSVPQQCKANYRRKKWVKQPNGVSR
ncbi:hypothetical protein AM500_03435 [Bacillus sp. FJAT-18017]|nr:hypothetical protein AM500_03435 [Bacillus sp. FJAT-18017]